MKYLMTKIKDADAKVTKMIGKLPRVVYSEKPMFYDIKILAEAIRHKSLEKLEVKLFYPLKLQSKNFFRKLKEL